MAKNRPPQQNAQPQFSGEEAEVVPSGPSGPTVPEVVPGTSDLVAATVGEKNKIERALMHLDFLQKEIKGLTADDSSLAGVMRRTAAQNKQQFAGLIEKWEPLAVIRKILLIVRDQVSD